MKSDKLYIGHILDAISGIEEYTANISYDEFLKDKKNARCGFEKAGSCWRSIKKIV